MKSTFLISCLIIFFAISLVLDAQTPDTVDLDKGRTDFVESAQFALLADTSDHVKWCSSDGAFLIFFESNPQDFFENIEADYVPYVDTNSCSATLVIRNDLKPNSEIQYSIFCITTKQWTSAPPRIIIVPTH